MKVHYRQQMLTGLRANTWDRGQQNYVIFEFWMLIDVIINILLQFLELLLQKRDGVIKGFTYQRWSPCYISFFLTIQFSSQILFDGIRASNQSL